MTGAGRTGGVEALKSYLKENIGALRARRADSPVVVVLDWDSRSKEASFATIFSGQTTNRVTSIPDTALNPKLGRSFHGIERAFPDRLIHEAETVAKPEGIEFSMGRKSGVYSVDTEHYGRIKEILYQKARQGLVEADLVHIRPFLEELLKSVANPS